MLALDTRSIDLKLHKLTSPGDTDPLQMKSGKIYRKHGPKNTIQI